MPRKKKEKEVGPDGKPLSHRKGRWNWMRAEKIVAVHAALAASEYGLTKAGGLDGPNSSHKTPLHDDQKVLEDSLHKRCEVEYERIATGTMSHLFRTEKHGAQESVGLRCVAGGGAQIWLRWQEVKKEITGRIFEVMSEFVDADGVPLSGTQWCLVVEKVRRAYWNMLQYTKAEDKNNKLSKKRKLMELAQAAANDGSSGAEEDVAGDDATDFDLAAMPENWNPVAYTIFVTLGPPALEKCIPALAWKAKGRSSANDFVDVEEVEPVQVSRVDEPSDCTILPSSTKQRPKNRLEMRKQKLEYDKEQKKKARTASGQRHGTPTNESPQPQFTPGTKAMLGVMDDVKQQVQAMNYQNSMLSLFQMEDDESAKAALKAEMLAFKNMLKDGVHRKQQQLSTTRTTNFAGHGASTTVDTDGQDAGSAAMPADETPDAVGQGSSLLQCASGGIDGDVCDSPDKAAPNGDGAQVGASSGNEFDCTDEEDLYTTP